MANVLSHSNFATFSYDILKLKQSGPTNALSHIALPISWCDTESSVPQTCVCVSVCLCVCGVCVCGVCGVVCVCVCGVCVCVCVCVYVCVWCVCVCGVCVCVWCVCVVCVCGVCGVCVCLRLIFSNFNILQCDLFLSQVLFQLVRPPKCTWRQYYKLLPLQISCSFEFKKMYSLYNINQRNAHFLKYYFNFKFVYFFDIFLTLKMDLWARNM
jgi:hypothetical protein